MKIRILYILFLFVFFFVSCSLNKKTVNREKEQEKKVMQFIYLFDEAGKNRLNGNLQTAEEQYFAALEINPKSAASDFYLASLYIIKKDFQTALSYAEKAVKLQPENFWYILEKADILKYTGQYKNAVSLYNILINKFPDNELPYNKLINIYTEKQDKENLISVYESKQNNFEFSPKTAVKLFNLYLLTKNYTKAEKTISGLIAKYPDEISYKGMAAEYYYSVNQINKAEKLYTELLSKYPNNTDINLSYALFCKKTNNRSEYFATTKKLMNSDLEFIKKTSLLNSGRFRNFPDNEYYILLKDLYQKHPDEILSNTFLAEYYIDKNNKQNAIPYNRKALELNSSDFNLALMLFSLEYDLKDFENMEKDTKKYLTFFPNRPQIFLYKGIADYNLNKFTDAENYLKSGKNLVIDNLSLEDQFNFYLALNYKKTKQFKEALTLSELILKHDNKNIKIYELYGDLLFIENKKIDALSYWKQAYNKGNNSKNLQYKIKNFKTLTIDDILK